MSAPPHLVYVGTYTRSGRSAGIHVFGHDPTSGRLVHRTTIEEVDPSFLTFDPSRSMLFVVSEGLGADGGAVASYAIDAQTGDLRWLSRQPTGGGEPCHLCTDPSGRWLLVANHEHGSVAVFPVDGEGRIAPRTDLVQHTGSGPGPTQRGPHAHHVAFDPGQQRLLVTDKGIDQVVSYRLDADTGKLQPNDPPAGRIHAGAAPRHLAFAADGRYAYVNGEADLTLAALSYDPQTGAMRELQSVSTVPPDERPNGWSTAELAVDATGRFAYVSNRGHDSIAYFGLDAASGRITPLGHVATGGRTPRHFAIEPSGARMYVGNQESDTIVAFEIDPTSGGLTPAGLVTEIGAPVCILFS